MKREIPKATFVGPITKRAKCYSFLILQGGMDPIKLEYPSQMVSRQSRAQLLETHHTYPVPSTKLLMVNSVQAIPDEPAPLHLSFEVFMSRPVISGFRFGGFFRH